jgi:tetratricopeptide (TPR) repeat protein
LTKKSGIWLACAGLLAVSCIQGGARSGLYSSGTWEELRSKHFVLVSDLGDSDASHVLAGFEETYDLLGEVVFGVGVVPSFTTNVVIFDSHTDLNQFIGDGFGGVYLPSLPNDAEPSPTLLASGTLSPFARLLFAHELTHRFNHVALGPTPTWLNEGLADYYSTIRAGDHAAPITGEIDPRYMCTPDGLGDLECYQYEKMPGRQLPSASEVMALEWSEFYGTDDTSASGSSTWEQKQKRGKNYSVAWLLVHMLMHSDKPYAEQFRRTLASPSSGQKGERLAKVLTQVAPAEIDRDFHEYLGRRIPWRQHHAPLPEPPSNLERLTMDEARVSLWLARLDAFNGKFGSRAHERLNVASQRSTFGLDRAAASFWQGRYSQLHEHDPQSAARYYHRALEQDPGNPEYLYGLLDLYWSPSSGLSWIEATRSVNVGRTIDALAKTARSPRQLNAVAAYQLFAHDLQGALRSSEQACHVGFDCWPCFHNRAAALFASGQASEALAAEREALNRLPEGAPPQDVQLLTTAVSFYEAANEDPESTRGKPLPNLLAP